MSETIEKGFIANIYKDKSCNCSNKGISHWYDEVMIVSTIKELQLWDITPKQQLKTALVVIKEKYVCGNKYIYAEPIDDPEGVGWMMGGTFIYSCDSRFRRNCSNYPIPLHDRQETN